jgi:MarR family 2-MHQ and catechol resistance regulon transcriptional repressor
VGITPKAYLADLIDLESSLSSASTAIRIDHPNPHATAFAPTICLCALNQLAFMMPTHYKGDPAEILALDTVIKLERAASSLIVRLQRLFAEWNLTDSQFGVLETLFHLGPMCQSELASKQLNTPGNMTMVVDNLEKRGLVHRERSIRDRRFISVDLTAEGHQLIARIFPIHARQLAEAFGVLSSSEQEELGRLCRKLGLGVSEKTRSEGLTKEAKA